MLLSIIGKVSYLFSVEMVSVVRIFDLVKWKRYVFLEFVRRCNGLEDEFLDFVVDFDDER